jgi:hypothetical protein
MSSLTAIGPGAIKRAVEAPVLLGNIVVGGHS